MPRRSWGWWTEQKLDVLADYLAAFTKASMRAGTTVYLDLFAGQAQNVSRSRDEHVIRGSARRPGPHGTAHRHHTTSRSGRAAPRSPLASSTAACSASRAIIGAASQGQDPARGSGRRASSAASSLPAGLPAHGVVHAVSALATSDAAVMVLASRTRSSSSIAPTCASTRVQATAVGRRRGPPLINRGHRQPQPTWPANRSGPGAAVLGSDCRVILTRARSLAA